MSNQRINDSYVRRIEKDRRLLELLSQTFGNVSAAGTEIINLEAILNLPKGTEHFVADIHGEHEAFTHILKNASGNIKRKVTDLFGTTMRSDEIRELCSLIYYPEKKLEYILASEENMDDFQQSLVCAFRTDGITPEDMHTIAKFKSIVNNYLKMCNLLK